MKGKVLVHNGRYVDIERLGEGIFYTDYPEILGDSVSILYLIDRERYVAKFTGEQGSFQSEFKICNLRKCKLLKTSTKYG